VDLAWCVIRQFSNDYPILTTTTRFKNLMQSISVRKLKPIQKPPTGPIFGIGLFISLVPLSLMVLLFILFYPGLLTDSRIAQQPVPVQQATARGHVVSKIFLSTADLPIEYTVASGKRFHAQGRTFIFGEFNHHSRLQVFYLRDHPEIATTGWALDALPLRWKTFWAFVGIFGFGVLLVWALTAAAIYSAKSLERTAADPVAIEVAIVSRRSVRNRVHWSYAWESPNSKERENSISWPANRKPYFTTPTEDRALAISNRKGAAHLVDASGRPFDLTPVELEDLRKQLRGAELA
jgi:hypothetical protein